MRRLVRNGLIEFRHLSRGVLLFVIYFLIFLAS